MLPPEILKKIKNIQIKTNYLANEMFSGEYESAFRGRGMEFEEVREYQPGDEIRSIDWNVTARLGRPFVKIYREEREMTVMILVDVSPSLEFGTRQRLKRETAAELAAVLAYAAVKSNDKVGLIIFSDRVEKYIAPRKGRGHIYRIIQEILTFVPEHRATTDLKAPLEYLMRVMHHHCITFMISDFLGEGYERALDVCKRRHDVVCLQLYDAAERQFPSLGYAYWQDPESKQEYWINTSRRDFERDFVAKSAELWGKAQKNFRELGVDHVAIRQDSDYVHPLMQFFRYREKRR